uniref:Uncharacterized protein n=1 Tax=Anguilla anguilla TaxID=7936 RepID=A0A0E9WB62_ANGAN
MQCHYPGSFHTTVHSQDCTVPSRRKTFHVQLWQVPECPIDWWGSLDSAKTQTPKLSEPSYPGAT